MAKAKLARIKISPYDSVKKIAELAGLDTSDEAGSENVFYNGKYLFVTVKQDVLDAAYATYLSDLENNLLKDKRKDKSERIAKKAFNFIEEKYPVFRQQFFQALFTEAVALGLTNRVTYIKGLLDWCKSVVEYTNTLDDQLETMTSAQEIGALFPDFSSFEENDPQVTIKGALAIED